jgi:hypothetical protein
MAQVGGNVEYIKLAESVPHNQSALFFEAKKKYASGRKIGRRETRIKVNAKDSTCHGICDDKLLGPFIPRNDGTRKRFWTTSRSNDQFLFPGPDEEWCAPYASACIFVLRLIAFRLLYTENRE